MADYPRTSAALHAGGHLRRSRGLVGDNSLQRMVGRSVSVFINQSLHQICSSDDVLAARKTRDFHVAILEDINLHSLPDQRQRDEHRVLAIA
jgi:hypothetical protein